MESRLRRERLQAWKRTFHSIVLAYKNRKTGILGLVIVLFFASMALFAPYVSPFDPYERVARAFRPPSVTHLLGTNDIGQDILSELIHGAQVSLLIGFLAALAVVTIGTLLGIISGYFGGLVDEILMRFCDIILVLPNLPLMILLAAILGRQSFHVIVLALTVTAWPGLSRMIRSATLSLKERPFVEAARALGADDSRIMLKHILPNVSPLMLSAVVYEAAGAMMAEAGLSFLGLGDPARKSWGMILHYAQVSGGWWGNQGYPAWWWILPPGLCIAFTVLGLMLTGQVFEELVDPRLRRR